MAQFETKANLPQKTQDEITRVQAIASAQRTSVEANFLTALGDYLYNEILLKNAALEIVLASGVTVPTGFAKGALFTKTNATDQFHGVLAPRLTRLGLLTF